MLAPLEPKTSLVLHQSSFTANIKATAANLLNSSFLAALVLFAAMQLPLQCLGPKLHSLESANYEFVRRSVPKEGIRASVVCLGDSLLKQGVSPRILENQLQERVINLSVIGSRPMATYCILRRLLREGGQPKLLLVDFEPDILYSDPRSAVHESAEFYDVEDCLDAALTVGDYNYAGSLLTAVLLPSYRMKYALVDFVTELIRNRRSPDFSQVKKYSRNWLVNKGQSLEPAQHGPLPDDSKQADNIVKEWRKVFQSHSPWVCNQINQTYMSKFIDLANHNSIKVFWLITPMHPRAQKEMEETGVEAAYVKLARNLQSRFPNLVVIDGRHANYDGHFFIDSEHFHRHGATVYSKALGKILQLKGKDRWIELPQCDRSDIDKTLEDVEQSSKIPLQKGT